MGAKLDLLTTSIVCSSAMCMCGASADELLPTGTGKTYYSIGPRNNERIKRTHSSKTVDGMTPSSEKLTTSSNVIVTSRPTREPRRGDIEYHRTLSSGMVGAGGEIKVSFKTMPFKCPCRT